MYAFKSVRTNFINHYLEHLQEKNIAVPTKDVLRTEIKKSQDIFANQYVLGHLKAKIEWGMDRFLCLEDSECLKRPWDIFPMSEDIHIFKCLQTCISQRHSRAVLFELQYYNSMIVFI